MRSFKKLLRDTFSSSQKERPYRIGCDIGFFFEPFELDAEIDTELLAKAIRTVDQENPWKDEPLPFEKHESIRFLSPGKVVRHNMSRPLVVAWFSIIPGRECVTKGQLHAYEKYVEVLVKELGNMNLENVTKVGGNFSCGSHKSSRM